MGQVELDKISDKSKGLPDCWHIDGNDRSSPEVLHKHFRLPRGLRNDKRILESLLSRSTRLYRFTTAVIHFRYLNTPLILHGDKYVSPEAHAMSRFDPSWHMRSEDELSEVEKLEDERLRTMLTELLALRLHRDIKPHQGKIQGIANRSSTTVEHAFEVTMKCAIDCWMRAYKELSHWPAMDAGRQSLIAEVLFAGFTFFGKRALEMVAEVQPDVLMHYRHFAGYGSVGNAGQMYRHGNDESNGASGLETDGCWREQQQALGDACVNTVASDAVPATFLDLYKQVASITATAVSASDPGPQYALRIRTLLDLHVGRLEASLAVQTLEELNQDIARYCDAVLAMVSLLDFADSEHQDLVVILRDAWRRAVTDALRSGRPRSWYDTALEERRILPEIQSRFDVERDVISDAKAELDAIAMQLPHAKFTARTALKARETKRQSEIRNAMHELEVIRVEAAHSLVPDGMTLDELIEDASGHISTITTLEGVRVEAARSLREVVESLDAIPGRLAEDVQVATALTPDQSGAFGGTLIQRGLQEDHQADLAQDEPAESQALPVDLVASPTDAKDLEQVLEGLGPTPDKLAVSGALNAGFPVAQDGPRSSTGSGAVLEDDPTGNNASGHSEESDISQLDIALRDLQYTESSDDAMKAFRIAVDQFNQVPSAVGDALAMHWLERGHPTVAYQILRDANESSLFPERLLDAALLRSAFYGINLWPKDHDALNYTQRDLNLLNQRDVEEQLNRKPSGKLVPYLLACATLQPALFAGSETQAPTLLKLAAGYFDGPLKQLVSSTAEFSMRGGRVDLEALRNEEGQEAHLAATRLQDKVNTWVDLNAQRTTRWHALRVALKMCCDQPVIEPAIRAIRAGSDGDASVVRDFVSIYRSHAESRRLFEELVTEIRADAPIMDHIDSSAYTSFCQQIDSLVVIAQEWLLEFKPSEVRPKEMHEFVQRFHTQLDRSIVLLESSPRQGDLEHRAGGALLIKALKRLQAEIKADSHSTWRFEQTDAIFSLPQTLARLELGDVGADLRMDWYAMRVQSPRWLADMVDLASQHKANWAQLLLLRQLEDIGEDCDASIESVNAAIAVERSQIKQNIDEFRNLSVQALAVELLNEEDYMFNTVLASEWVEKLSNLKPVVDVTSIRDEVNSKARGLEKLLNSNAATLAEELDQALLNIRTNVGTDAVPDGWDSRARQALDRKNLIVVRELINQLQDHTNRNVRLPENLLQENGDLRGFVSTEAALFELLQAHQNPREAGERVIQEQPGGFDYSRLRGPFKATMGTLMEWRSRGPNRRPLLDRKTYEGIIEVLRFIGFEEQYPEGTSDVLLDCEYSNVGDFRRLKVRIACPALPKGFPLFEGEIGSYLPLNVIFVQGAWNLAGLKELVERNGLPDRAVLMVGEPLSPDDRKTFATFCRDRKCTIFLLDPVVLAFVGTAAHQQATLELFLKVSTAWTFYNPYTKGDARLPAPPEMRFGRENDIASLIEPRGAALVYGGRQLGKTTLLNSAVQAFKKRDPSHNHAFYLRMDGPFQNAVERSGMDVKTRFLEVLVKHLVEAKVMPPTQPGTFFSAEERLRTEFLRQGSSRVLFCLDEIDSVLNWDARKDFELVRSLVALVNDPHHRFRIVFAGLNNVNRFRTYPNVPLEQLGSSLPVKILSPQDARSLILQPLTSLGYAFEEDESVDRIMAFTNRHPSLLHIFCSELVEQLCRDRAPASGLRIIRQSDVESIESNSDVRRLSGERFDMTLNLDKRYTVAVYGLIDHYGKGIGKFTVKQALDVAKDRVPEEFAQMSEAGFEALLKELVGLGVLRDVDKLNHQYAIRNQSILQLIGNTNDIAHKLQVAIRDLKKHADDALTYHPSGSNLPPSPLTLQDENQILSAESPDGAPHYSVSVIMGTPALGLSIKSIQDSFSTISEYKTGKLLSAPSIKAISREQDLEFNRFAEIVEIAIESWASQQPTVLLVSLEQTSSIRTIVDLVSIANEKAGKATRLVHPLRIVFLLGAGAMWSWHAHPWLTSSPSELGGLVELKRWTRHACEGLLDQQGLVVTADQAAQLHKATEGWHTPLMKFLEVRKKRSKAGSFQDLERDFTPLKELPQRDFAKFLQQTGILELPWSMPLASKLHEFDSLEEFSDADLQTAIEFLPTEVQDLLSPEQTGSVIRWWTGLRVIEANSIEASTKAGKSGEVTYRFTPALKRAIVEYSAQAAAIA